jgi:hypothetical protein
LRESIGVFGFASQKHSSFFCDYHISAIMKQACIWSYPNPNHYMRFNIEQITLHSNSITATVSLKLGGATMDEEIAFRL